MAAQHGKTTQVTINSVDLSPYSNNTEFSHESDTHETTTYKADETDTSKTYIGGLTDGTATLSGIYDNTETDGPRATIEGVLGTVVPFIYQPEGAGTGKPERTMDVVVQTYSETAPVGDLITWSCDLQVTGPITTNTQA